MFNQLRDLGSLDVAGARRVGQRELIGAGGRSFAVVRRRETLRLKRRIRCEI